MFTPDDNDWTDCDRNSGVNSLERLNYERQLLFSTPYSFGTHPLLQEVQAAPYVENRRWTVKDVTYATVNIQGACNNLGDVAPDSAEEAARNAADIAWLQDTFKEAKDNRSAAVMIIGQADPGFELRNLTVDFRRPVAYVHGDSHYFRVDRPFLDSQERRLENFTRVETFGDNQVNGTNDVQWLKVPIDPHSRDVFAFQPQIVPANRVAEPAP